MMRLETFAMSIIQFERAGFKEDMLTIDGIKRAAIVNQHTTYALLVAKDAIYLANNMPDTQKETRMMFQALRQFCNDHDVAETWFISEIWFVVRAHNDLPEKHRPSDCDDRIEGLLCIHEQPDGKTLQWIFHIVRDDDGKILALLPYEDASDPMATFVNPKWIIHKPIEPVEVIH